MLPWFQDRFPLYLAPMAGVTDTTFRQLCKEYGADVMVTEFVSAEGIFRRNERTMEYLDFEEAERPLGVQLFGDLEGRTIGIGDHLGQAVMVAQIDEQHAAVVADAVAPSGEADFLSDQGLGRLGAGVGTVGVHGFESRM